MQQFFISTNNGRRVVSEVKRSRRTNKMTSFDTSSDPRAAVVLDRLNAETVAKETGGTVEPYSNIVRFYQPR